MVVREVERSTRAAFGPAGCLGSHNPFLSNPSRLLPLSHSIFLPVPVIVAAFIYIAPLLPLPCRLARLTLSLALSLAPTTVS
jgi:hypothetical protein